MIFIEETNKPDFSDRNTVIYGHNMSNASKKYAPMFQDVEKFTDKDFVGSIKDKVVKIYDEDGVKTYRIFSAYHLNAYDDYRRSEMDDDQWLAYINDFRQKSILDFQYEKDLKSSDKIITLSTCDNEEINDENGRYTVHAVLQEE